jgi:hypothetical protein
VAFDGQETKRRYEEFRDQHGRIWRANIEIKTGDPCENLQPSGWTAPIGPDWFVGKMIPPEDVVKMVPARMRARRGYQVQIDYDLWMQKVEERRVDYQTKIAQIAEGMTKGSGRTLELIENPSKELLKFVGPAPFPPLLFIQAAAAGNAWMLGDADLVPAKAQALLDELKPMITGQRKALDLNIDPFADELEEEEEEAYAGAAAAIDPFGDLEEQFDPEATGGKRVPPRKSKKGRQE